MPSDLCAPEQLEHHVHPCAQTTAGSMSLAPWSYIDKVLISTLGMGLRRVYDMRSHRHRAARALLLMVVCIAAWRVYRGSLRRCRDVASPCYNVRINPTASVSRRRAECQISKVDEWPGREPQRWLSGHSNPDRQARWRVQGSGRGAGGAHSSRSRRFLMNSAVCALIPASDLFAASSTGSRRPATDLCARTSYSCLHTHTLVIRWLAACESSSVTGAQVDAYVCTVHPT